MSPYLVLAPYCIVDFYADYVLSSFGASISLTLHTTKVDWVPTSTSKGRSTGITLEYKKPLNSIENLNNAIRRIQ